MPGEVISWIGDARLMHKSVIVFLKFQFVSKNSCWQFCFILVIQRQNWFMIGANQKVGQAMQINVIPFENYSSTLNFYLRVAVFRFSSGPAIVSENPISVELRV